jgi:hypothetical protein
MVAVVSIWLFSHNPKPESLLRGWMLLSLLAESCPPPPSFLFFVLNFVDLHIAGTHPTHTILFLSFSIPFFLPLHHVSAPVLMTVVTAPDVSGDVKGYATYVLHALRVREHTRIHTNKRRLADMACGND